MKRHEAWRAAYRMDRYLKRASIEALERRSQDIASNMLDVNEAGQLTPGNFRNNMVWWELWTHILEELAIRGTEYGSVQLMTPDQFPWITHPDIPRGLRILRNRKIPSGSLVRLGQKEHIKASFNLGRFRIAPAASYSDPSLNPAIKDDELSVTAVASGEHAIVRPFDPKTGKSGDPIPVIGEITYSRSLRDNFYVVCMTAGYSPRLLDDFSADALIAIHNVDRFLIRIEKAVKQERPELSLGANVVTYYDPYRVKPDAIDPFFSKNFRFAYQKEYRLVWYSEGLPLDCEPFFVEIETMRDIASLHVLQD
jgi:hypothetical protein